MIALLLLIASPNDAVTRARFYGAIAGIPTPADTARVIAIHGRVYEDGTPAEVTEPLPDVRDAYAYAIIGALRGSPPPRTGGSRESSQPILTVRVGRTHVITRDGDSKVEAAVLACAPRSDIARVLFVDVRVQNGKIVASAFAACLEAQLKRPAEGVTSMAIEVGPLRPLVDLTDEPSDIRDIMRSAVKACDDPNAPGVYKMRLVISQTGAVSAIEAQGTPRGGERVSQCIAKAIKELRFPKPTSGAPMILTYPVVFKQQL